MKTLDEVIALLEDERRCDVPQFKDDLLHHLKEYKNLQMGYIRAIADLEDNPPLTWDELKGMEGKPVWVEWTGIDRWGVVDGIFTDAFGVENLCISVPHDYLHFDRRMKEQTWEAYRKERK